MFKFLRAKGLMAALLVMLVALASANALLIRQNLQLRGALERYNPQGARAGARLQPFAAEGLRGDRVNVEYAVGGVKHIFIYFTPTCPYCRGQFAYWREMLERVDRKRFEVIGLVSASEDKEKLEEYLRAVGCGADSHTPLRVALTPDAVRQSYQLSLTPITLLVRDDGTVEKAWNGRWDGAALDSAGALFGFGFSKS